MSRAQSLPIVHSVLYLSKELAIVQYAGIPRSALRSIVNYVVVTACFAVLGSYAPLGGAAILTTGLGNATAIGIERSFDGAIIKTVTEKTDTVASSARRALQTMGFKEDRTAAADGIITIWASSPRREVQVKLAAISENTTRIRIDVDRGWIFREDPSTAAEIMIQTELALGKRG